MRTDGSSPHRLQMVALYFYKRVKVRGWMVKKELVFIVLGETLWQSILSDLFTLSSLVFCMFLSVNMDSTFWTVFSAILFLIMLFSRTLKKQSTFRKFLGVKELADWANNEVNNDSK